MAVLARNFTNLYLSHYLADRGRVWTDGTVEGRTALWATSSELWLTFDKVGLTSPETVSDGFNSRFRSRQA
jgi:hypothetical protein